jgi:hypothetical protein
MRIVTMLALLGLTALAACDVSHPVAVVGPSNSVFRGTANATFLEGGWFQVTNGKTSCQGRYRPASENKTVTFPVTCSNGLKGVGTATYETPRAGGGEIVMQDGTHWQFIFGRAALAI